MRHIISENAGDPVGGFRSTLMGMLGTCGYERAILGTARELINGGAYSEPLPSPHHIWACGPGCADLGTSSRTCSPPPPTSPAGTLEELYRARRQAIGVGSVRVAEGEGGGPKLAADLAERAGGSDRQQTCRGSQT